MALQNFVDKIGPVVSAVWLNAVDLLKETIFENATTKAAARTNLTSDLPLEIVNGGTSVRTLLALQGLVGTAVPGTDEESSASVIPTNTLYPPGNVLRYGADPTGVADSTDALQSAINVASYGVRKVTIPAGHYKFTQLYFHYDAGTNPNFNHTATSYQGRLWVEGVGCGDYQNFFNDVPVGTVLESTEASGTCINVGTGATPGGDNIRGVVFSGVAVWGSTTGTVVHWNYVSGWSRMDRCFIGNNAAGGNGLKLNDVWNCGLSDVEVAGLGLASGIGVQWQNILFAAGICQMNNVTAKQWTKGIVIGGLSLAAGQATRCSTFTGLQAASCADGITVGYGSQDNMFISCWTEDNANCGFRAAYSCINNSFVSCYSYEPNATEASFVLGLNGGTIDTTAHLRTDIINYTADAVNVYGIARYAGSKDLNCSIDTPRLIAKAVGVGTAIMLNDSGQHGLTIIRPTMTNFQYDIADSVGNSRTNVVDLVITEDTLGRWLFNAPVRVTKAFEMQDAITAPVAQAGVAQLYVDVADNKLKVMFGDGTVVELATNT